MPFATCTYFSPHTWHGEGHHWMDLKILLIIQYVGKTT